MTVAAADTTPAPVGFAGEAIGSGFMLQFTAGLLVVLMSVVGLAWLLRRVGRLQSSADGTLRVIGGLALGTRERVVLVQVGETQVLLGVAPGRVQAVHVLQEPVVTGKESESVTGSFAVRLKEALKMEKTP
jgi:flagellar protein FliO/FliZ